jgi:ABC-type multidrug transport system fused ATPase/permease subunit
MLPLMIRNSIVHRSASVLPKSDQKKLISIILLQILLGGLDLVGVAFVGVLGALAVNGIQSKQPGNRVSQVLGLLQIGDRNFQFQVSVIGAIAAITLITKTLASVYFSRKTMFFLSRRGGYISSTLLGKFLTQPLIQVQLRKSSETLYTLTHGVSAVTLGILSLSLNCIADISLLLVMSIGLFLIDPIMALCTFLVFGAIGFCLYRILSVRARHLGFLETQLNIETNSKVIEVLNSYREIVVKNRRSFYANRIGKIRFELADTQAEMYFMPNIGKYVIESSMVLGGLLLAGIMFMREDATRAVGILSLFLAAGSRIAPAILRIQQNAIQIRSNIGTATPTLDLIEELKRVELLNEADNGPSFSHAGFIPKVFLKDVSFTYPERENPALKEINLDIHPGEALAIVGPSGAGKTTLVDVLLGVIEPNHGRVEVSGLAPAEAITKYAGAIAYVPQDVVIIDASIKENVAMGFDFKPEYEGNVLNALRSAQFKLEEGSIHLTLDSEVGERGTNLSGGQRQRLGIARALFTMPKLLVLDEATSSLDGQTEAAFAAAISGLKGKTTVVTIAHRLSTVRASDRVVYMENGRVLAIGTFEEVRGLIPDFDAQAKLMGL